MFRFSCFHSPTNSQKLKKTVHLPTESMQKSLEDYHPNQPKKDPVFSKEVPEVDNSDPSQSSMVQDWKSEGPKSKIDIHSEDGHETRRMRKSISLGSGLEHYQEITPGEESSVSNGNLSESINQVEDKDESQNVHASASPPISSNLVNRQSDISQQSEKDFGANSETRFSGRGPYISHSIVKSCSLPYLHSAQGNTAHPSQSSDNFKALGSEQDDKSEDGTEEDSAGQIEKTDGDEGDDGYDYVGMAKDWIVPGVDEVDKGKSVQKDFSGCQWEELPNEDFKIKRIEKWVMDLQHCSSLDETNLVSDVDQGQSSKNTTVLDPVAGSKVDDKVVVGMDAAKRYISSLSPSATAAQLTNHGLVVIPFLSAFSSLRALNLSGNSIVRITAGALPRGLHILNLSKNNISIIEGLRELTRLRVLDLSYNRILRIGHGLASCSSLKELYLAGNKISEVEGLHRLLKLNVLDLRFNKLSTTKSLGQLAANYNSLQAISLEANPAQKNIGDEPLKKFLLGLLPHLSYFNRQSIKSGTMKDSADRAARLGISAHQIDRGMRGEAKKSGHGRKSQPVAARGRHVRLPPSGVKMTGDRHQLRDVSPNLTSFRPDLAMRRTHSEGLLRAA